MNAFFKKNRKLHIWLLAELTLLAAFWLCRSQRAWMNAWADHVVTPLRRAVGSLCYRTTVSVMEVVYVLLVLAGLAYLIWSVAAVVKAKGRRRARTYTAALGVLCIGVTIYVGCCYLWGVHYYTDSFQDQSGIRAEAVSVETLTEVTQYFADRLQETAGLVERDESGAFAVSREEILLGGTMVYDAVEVEFPFLYFHDAPPKALYFSRLMSAMDFTGVYFPYTGESNVNVDSPACMLPSTVAHELAHQRSIASEQECNFLAVLASTTCGDPTYVYSGWLMGYVYLSNALYRVDVDTWKQIRASLPEPVLVDMQINNQYWEQFRDNPAQKVSTKVYDRFLKSYGEEKGIQSYGTVVDLLVVYYGETT